MDNSKKSDLVKNSDFEYTIVLDKDYMGQSGAGAKDVTVKRFEPSAQTGHGTAMDRQSSAQAKHGAAADRQAPAQTEHEAAMDSLYFEYEKLWLMSPTVIEKGDVYPRSYYWRLGGRYDPDKKAVLEEALAVGKMIEYTEAYQQYVEKIKNVKFKPDSWD